VRGRRPSETAARSTPAIVVGSDLAGLGVIRALGEMDVPVLATYSSPHEFGRVSRHVSRALRSPPPVQEERFVDFLADLGSRYEGAVLVPVSDEAVTAVARHTPTLSPRFRVACMDWPIVETFIDKRRTYELARAVGVPAPRTLLPRDAAEVERCGKAVGYPCLLKPSHAHLYRSSFGRKLVKAAGPDELLEAWTEAEQAGLGSMVQEFIPGPDSHGANYNSYFVDGQPVVACTAQKVRLQPPEVGYPRVVLSRNLPEVAAQGATLLQAMGVEGFTCTEFKLDARDGSYKLMEVNGRHNNSTLLSVRSGVNFPYVMYRHLVAGEVPSDGSWRSGVYWIDPLSDLTQSVRYAGRERHSAREYLRPYVREHVFGTLARGDLAPLALQLTYKASGFAARTARFASRAAFSRR
jgi:D-aspartate ligase